MISKFTKRSNWPAWMSDWRGLAAAFGVLAAIFVAINGWIYLQERRHATLHQQNLLQAATNDALAQIGQWRQDRAEQALHLVHNEHYRTALVEFLRGKERSPFWAGFQEELRSLLDVSNYEGAFVLDAKGRLRFSEGRVFSREANWRGHVADALRTGEMEFYAFGGGASTRIQILTPLFNGSAQPLGVLGFQLLPRLDFGALDAAWPIADTSVKAFVVSGGKVISPQYSGGIVDLASLQRSSTGFVTARDSRGRKLIAHVTDIRDTPWLLVTSMDAGAFMEPFRRLSVWSISLTLLSLLISALLAYVLWHRKQAQQALREMQARREREVLEQRFDYLAKFANDAIILFDKDRRIVEVNDKAVELYGYTRDEFSSKPVIELRALSATENLDADWATVGERPSVMYETVHRAKDGREFPVEVSARRITVDNRFFVQSIIRDVSERKRNERRIRRLTGLYAALSRANEAIARHYSQEGLLPEICRIAVEEGHYSAAYVALADSNGELQVAASSGELARMVYDSRLLEVVRDSEGPAIAAFSEGKPVVSNDYTHDPRTVGAHERAREYGVNSSAAFPLRRGETVIGTLGVVSREVDYFDHDQMVLLQDLAADLSLALDNIERDQRRRLAERMTRDNEIRYRALFENMSNGALVLVRNEGGFIVKDVNAALEHIEHVSRRDVVGRRLEDVFSWAPHCLVPAAEQVWREGVAVTIPAHCHVTEEIGWRESYALRLPTEELVVVIEDVTRRVEAVEALRRSEERLAAVLEGTEDAYWDFNFETGEVYYSKRFAELFGYATEELGTGMDSWQKMVHPSDIIEVQRRLADHLGGRTPQFVSEHRMRHRERGYIWVRGRGRVVRRADDGRPMRMAGTHTDISAQRASEEQLRLWASVFEHSREAIVVTDPERHIVSVNGAFTAITGYTAEEVRGRDPSFLSSGVHDRAFYQTMWAAIEESGHWQGEIQDRRKDGEIFPLWIAITAAKDPQGRVQNYIAICSDMSERKEAEERIRHLAYHDALTGLPNRALFGDRLAFALAHAERHEQGVAVLFLDLDRFKNINDSLGHAVGDKLLVEVAERLRACVRREDTVGRQGGDEFLVLLSELNNSQDVIQVARKVQEELGRPCLLDGVEVRVTPSIGIAVSPEDGRDAVTLIRNADAAMYYAKERGRNNFQFFTEELNARARSRLSLESSLRHAIEAGDFVLHYQPQVDLGSGALVGAEALLRWRRDGELVTPGDFLPLAEETGLMIPIGDWVFREVFRQQGEWEAAGMPPVRVAVNVSASEFRQKDLAERLRKAGGEHVEPGKLELEIKESMLLREPDSGTSVLRTLKDVGVALALDDFGGGRSSLTDLRSFPFDHIKVAPSFVRDLRRGPADRAMTEAIISVARSLGIRVIAEGVEAEEEVSVLREQRCHEVQGRYLAPPLGPEEFAAWWREHHAGRPTQPPALA